MSKPSSNATPSLLLAALVALPFLGSCTSTGAYRAKVTPQRMSDECCWCTHLVK